MPRTLLLVLLGLVGRPVLGHQASVVYSELTVSGRVVDYTFQVANRDLYEALGLDRDRPATQQEALAGRARLGSYLAERVTVENHGHPCAGRPEESTLLPRSDGFFFVQRVRYQCARSIEDALITYNLFFDIDPRHQALVHVRAFGSESEQVLRASSRTLRLQHALGRWDNARDYLELGVEHIFTGYDHLAFVFCLLILAGGLRDERERRPGGAGLRHAVQVITAFTLAHSVTLIVAAFGWVRLPSKPVEVVIALSIGYVAVENLLQPRPRHRFLVTFAFGLVHGFGFASVLRELGLPRSGLLLSLLSFNLGVELGQLLVVALCFPLLHLLSVRGPGTRLRPLEVVAVAVLAFVSIGVLSRFGLPWPPLVVVALGTPMLLLYLVPRYGYDRCLRRGGSTVILALSLLWLLERVLDRSLLGGLLG